MSLSLNRLLFAGLVSSLALLTGCSTTRVVMHSGGMSESQIAIIPWDEGQKEIHVLAVDDTPVRAAKPDIEILPGAHTVEVIYRPNNTLHSYPVKLRFYAEAGHRYGLSAKMGTGTISDDGVWGGKYRAEIVDITSGNRVATTARAPKPRRIDMSEEIIPPGPGRDVDFN